MGRTFERRSTVDKGAQHLIVYPVPTTECQSVENSCDTAFDRWPLSSTSPFNDQDFIYIYTRTRAKATNARPINFVFPIPGGEEFFVMQICSFKREEEEEEEGRSDRHASKGSRFLSTDLVLFVFIPLSPSLRFCEENSCVSRGKKGQADAMHRYLDDKSNELIVFN